MRKTSAVLVAAGLVMSACGDGDEQVAGGGDVTTVTAGTAGGAECMSTDEASSLLEDATYAIVMQQLRGYDEDDQPVYSNFFVGTGWAVSDRQIVTNAHVAEVPFDYPGIKVVAVQAGTGTVVNLLTAYMHPDYDSGTNSPDVGLFTTQERMPATLPLAVGDPVDLSARQEVLLTGFPGDVEEFFPINPGEGAPQASATAGLITALRNFDDTVQVEPANVDVIQHDAPTTGGNSGSALFSCSDVIGIHNAGVSFEVFVQEATGEVTLERVSGTNRFGIHVKYIRDLLDLIASGALDGQTIQGDGNLPFDACPEPSTYLDAVAAGTYAVVLEVLFGYDVAGQPVIGYFPIGTAFAVDRRLLVTNAHITEGTKQSQLPVLRVLAVQSGTGEVVNLLRGLTHPGYNGDPLRSPDVGLFTTESQLPSPLQLEDPAAVNLLRGDPISVTGFPGDVNDFIEVIPGQTVPQATSLSGTVTALRAHSEQTAVDATNTDVIQHQAPTTPGTSGSALVRCGRVAGINNAGTVQLVVAYDPATDSAFVDRTAAASNNFAVHVKHIVELLDLFNTQSLQGFELPPPPVQGIPGQGSGQQATSDDWFAGTWEGEATSTNPGHTFIFTVAADGTLSGSSYWPTTGEFTITGRVDANGAVTFTDDANARLGFRTGNYTGFLSPDGTGQGDYFEATQEGTRYLWTVRKTG